MSQSPFERACQSVGGLVKLAGLLGKKKQTVSHYRNRVPAEVCPLIEKHTGVKCEELRPDVEWGVLRRKTKQEA